ncbi:MAG TPA: heme-binding protein [Candidatus Limnocylindrales bacterium]|nr:heme-binding protein [Candidatus Limnocylindrales bacterium]
MPDVRPHAKLTHEGALKILHAALAKAQEIRVPQCIAVTDDGGHLLAFVQMDGARRLSQRSAIRKAQTAASNQAPTGGIPAELEVKLALATGGAVVNLKGGLPIVVDGQLVGAIGVGSGTQDQDVEVARAGIAALSAATPV